MFLTKEQMSRRRWKKFCELLGVLATALVFVAVVVLMFVMA